MKTSAKLFLVLALATAAGTPVRAETGKAENLAAAVKVAAWERVGEAGAAPREVQPARDRVAEDGDLRARKAEMVRRMFWIVMAHR
ncbi:hypothetical protein EZJ19_04830 [Parasulfuritortus cantonensis]|uniref:Uncharacterized protein n=1 Tax=Parasulfuritortus cantonensis TaxID=2528202 RepID=A0A4R1BH14_9PROT|nr:hypothetical protein [Parasulfuritortus cantonensis]TCJ16510.1 hypothetical protein EZJ19_04830 [Parasulfuritortus cantonensis]